MSKKFRAETLNCSYDGEVIILKSPCSDNIDDSDVIAESDSEIGAMARVNPGSYTVIDFEQKNERVYIQLPTDLIVDLGRAITRFRYA